MNEEFEQAFEEELPPASPEKSEALLMREQEAGEYEDGWGMYPDSDNAGVETAPVRVGEAAATEIKPLSSSGSEDAGISFADAQAKAKTEGRESFMWNGRSFETGGTERNLAATQARKPSPTKTATPKPLVAAPTKSVEVLSEDEADARQFKPASVAAPAKPNHNSPSNVWPNNRPAKNIYANAGPSGSASPETQAARARLAQNLQGKSNMAEVMKGRQQ